MTGVHPWVNDDASAFDKCMREGSSCAAGGGGRDDGVIASRCCKVG
jgi:hypothetical protein